MAGNDSGSVGRGVRLVLETVTGQREGVSETSFKVRVSGGQGRSRAALFMVALCVYTHRMPMTPAIKQTTLHAPRIFAEWLPPTEEQHENQVLGALHIDLLPIAQVDVSQDPQGYFDNTPAQERFTVALTQAQIDHLIRILQRDPSSLREASGIQIVRKMPGDLH